MIQQSDRGSFLPLSDQRDIALISWHCHSMTVARRMSARASTAAALRAYRAKAPTGIRPRAPPASGSYGGLFFLFSGLDYSAGSNMSLPTPQMGQVQSSGISAKGVPGAMPLSGSPTSGSYSYPQGPHTYFLISAIALPPFLDSEPAVSAWSVFFNCTIKRISFPSHLLPFTHSSAAGAGPPASASGKNRSAAGLHTAQ